MTNNALSSCSDWKWKLHVQKSETVARVTLKLNKTHVQFETMMSSAQHSLACACQWGGKKKYLMLGVQPSCGCETSSMTGYSHAKLKWTGIGYRHTGDTEEHTGGHTADQTDKKPVQTPHIQSTSVGCIDFDVCQLSCNCLNSGTLCTPFCGKPHPSGNK